MQHIILSKETIGRIEYDAKAYCYDKSVHQEGVGYYFAGAMVEATKNIRIANALEALIHALADERLGNGFWNSEAAKAIEEGNAAILEQTQSIIEEQPNLPALFISGKIDPPQFGEYYCIIRIKERLDAKFERHIVKFIGSWDVRTDCEVTEWLCEDPDFIDKVNFGK
jgi:hypothetical protein